MKCFYDKQDFKAQPQCADGLCLFEINTEVPKFKGGLRGVSNHKQEIIMSPSKKKLWDW